LSTYDKTTPGLADRTVRRKRAERILERFLYLSSVQKNNESVKHQIRGEKCTRRFVKMANENETKTNT
jgi:hypothetical protein